VAGRCGFGAALRLQDFVERESPVAGQAGRASIVPILYLGNHKMCAFWQFEEIQIVFVAQARWVAVRGPSQPKALSD